MDLEVADNPDRARFLLIAAPMSLRAGLRYTGENRRRPIPDMEAMNMDYKLELVLIPVADVDRAKA
jgi:hypothetical protein